MILKNIYWAIPVGNYNHRNQDVKDRINRFLNYPDDDLRSCFYHIGRNTVKSIFFISDVIPVKKEYIDREYKGFDGNLYIIKNNILKHELAKKKTETITSLPMLLIVVNHVF